MSIPRGHGELIGSSLLACALFWSIQTSSQPVMVSLLGLYKTLKNQTEVPPVIEKSIHHSERDRFTTRVAQGSPPYSQTNRPSTQYSQINRLSTQYSQTNRPSTQYSPTNRPSTQYSPTNRPTTPASWKPRQGFEVPGKVPSRPRLKISHPYPIPGDNVAAGIYSPEICNTPTSISISAHSQPTSKRRSTSRTSRKSRTRSLLPRGRTCDALVTSSPYQQQIANSPATPSPARPTSRPMMPPAAFWRYAIDRQAVGLSPGILQSWQLERNRRSWPPSIDQSSPIPPSSPVSIPGRVKGRSDRRRDKRSRDGLEHHTFDRQAIESNTECIGGITWEIAGGRGVTQERSKGPENFGRRGQSRKLVKKRRRPQANGPGSSHVNGP